MTIILISKSNPPHPPQHYPSSSSGISKFQYYFSPFHVQLSGFLSSTSSISSVIAISATAFWRYRVFQSISSSLPASFCPDCPVISSWPHFRRLRYFILRNFITWQTRYGKWLPWHQERQLLIISYCFSFKSQNYKSCFLSWGEHVCKKLNLVEGFPGGSVVKNLPAM